jgi:mono/diheme cytochrome c family protein
MGSRLLFALCIFGLCGCGFAVAGQAMSEPDRARGQQLAARLCSNCHLVGTIQQEHANVDVPSFKEIANKEGQTEGAIVASILLPKHPMPAIPLTNSEIADLTAYIMSLRNPAEQANP